MGFINTIADMCAVDLSLCEYRLTMLGANCVYAEGVKRIKHYSQTEVVLCFKKTVAVIKGNGLIIEKFCGEDVAVKGSVSSIERVCC